MSLQFEWDEEKAKKNILKHGVSFETAVGVFFDENNITIYDEVHSQEEDRFITIGFSGKVLYVVYTERKEMIRLISARIATQEEKELYYGQI